MRKIFFITVCFLFITSIAFANGFLPDNIMKNPQEPDPSGWDVYAEVDAGIEVADDWECINSGPITGIYFWGSFKDDEIGDDNGVLDEVHLTVYSNDPASFPPGDPFSKPGSILWNGVFYNVQSNLNDIGSQGWLDPVSPDYLSDNHNYCYQYAILDIEDLVQEEGNTYWLGISVKDDDAEWGWKTSKDDDNANAVFRQSTWEPLLDHEGNHLAMSFVLLDTSPVPEPASMLLLFSGMLGLAGIRKKFLA